MSRIPEEDRDLEARFDAMRGEDARNVPTFESFWARGRAARPVARLRPAIAFAIVALVSVAVWRSRLPRARTPAVAFEAGVTRMPTDFLLESARYPRAGDLPLIGPEQWYPVSMDSNSTLNRRLP